MLFSCTELKRQARETLNGRYEIPIAAFVLLRLMITAARSPFQIFYQTRPTMMTAVTYCLAWLFIVLLSGILQCGKHKIHLDMARGKDTSFSDLFYFFKNKPDRLIMAQLYLLWKVFLTALMASAFIFLCGVLLAPLPPWAYKFCLVIVIILSIWGALYRLLPYYFFQEFLIDNEDMGAREAFQASKSCMKGSRGRLFYVMFSFLGMYLLCILSFGIGFLWIMPYMTQTQTAFYRNIIKEVS